MNPPKLGSNKTQSYIEFDSQYGPLRLIVEGTDVNLEYPKLGIKTTLFSAADITDISILIDKSE